MKRPAAASSAKKSVRKAAKRPASASPRGPAGALLDEQAWCNICGYLSGRCEGSALSFLSKTWKARAELLPQFVSVSLVPPAKLAEMDAEGNSDSDPDLAAELYGDLGRFDDPELKHTQNIEAHVFVCNKPVGKCDIVLIDLRRPLNFHEACDAPSAELSSVGLKFCNRHGYPRIASVKAALEHQEQRGFLYIKDFVLLTDETESHPIRADIGARALRSLLQDTALSGRWHLAVYVPDGLAQVSETRCLTDWKSRHIRSTGLNLSSQDIINFAEIDARQFLQSGFRQAKELAATSDCYHFFATPSFLNERVISFEEAVHVQILRKPLIENSARESNALDGALFKAVQGAMQEESLAEAVKSQIRRLIAQGATIGASRVVHCCAANLHAACFEFLLETCTQSVKSSVNARDRLGMTPLMCAASGAPGTSRCISFCTRLVALGADRNNQDPSGRTALGFARAARKNQSDFENIFGRRPPDEEYVRALQSLERVLMPSRGPSTADEAFSDSESSEEMADETSESEDMFDEPAESEE